MCPPPLCGRVEPSAANQGDRLVFGNITLQRPEPSQQGSVSLPGRFSWNPLLCAPRRRALFQGSLFSADCYFSVAIGCLQAHVAEPSANNIHLDACLQKMNRSAVPPEVGGYG